ncbi:MAG: ATP-binding cassette domain-containing protein [Chryseobacterium sp.]|jgi:ABC-2 type transport system ATP-binding protein|uniref:ABC transporter ATP-binding protein n=1 Tax=Chryseobacterium sp. TaxID=1871047 RepID=UPI00281F338F|nr:ATP-binding cassette domain-containing protein [Chryseobacterium sp.]MDR2237165.1 ATP-binding cassette domain-containing protein [Chryseobacterium sp.]
MVLSLKNISFKYGNKQILDNICLDFMYGIYGLIGLNGEGKTTLLNIISTSVKPDSGQISYKGNSVLKNPLSLRKDLSYMPQNIALNYELSVYENLIYFGSLKGVSSKDLNKIIPYLLSFFNISQYKNSNIKKLSGGTLQRVSLALAFINSPKVLILDEPTNALDPVERINFYNLLKEKAKSSIIIISSHNISEIEKMVDKFITLNDKKISLFNDVVSFREGSNIKSELKNEILDFISK